MMEKNIISKRLKRNKQVAVFSFLILVLICGFVVFKYFSRIKKPIAATPLCDTASPRNCTISATPSPFGGRDYDYVITSSNTNLDESNLIIEGDSRGRTVVTIYGKHSFNNLTIDNATLTHSALEPQSVDAVGGTQDNDFDFSTSELTERGKNKKVDIVVRGNLALKNGGKIDVSGNGYPGSQGFMSLSNYVQFPADCGDNCGKGFGYGGGLNSDRHKPYTVGGGAGHYGFGGQGLTNGTALLSRGISYSNVPYGSGGGAARRHHHLTPYVPGGNGGGYINIITGDLLTDGNANNGIFADGLPPATGSTWASFGGSGSGGTINIKLVGYSGQTSFLVFARGGRADSGNQVGENGLVGVDEFAGDGSHLISVHADGGAGGPDFRGDYTGSSGSGGIVKIENKKNFTMKKELMASNRDGVGTNFDPYSLRIGDEISVFVTVTRIVAGAVIKDELLHNTAHSCNPIEGFYSDGGLTVNGQVTWTATDEWTEHTFSYKCKVQ